MLHEKCTCTCVFDHCTFTCTCIWFLSRPPTLPQVSASTLAQDFCSILDDGHLNDITVSLMNQVSAVIALFVMRCCCLSLQQGHPGFIAHKAVLASCSSVLRTLLEGHTTHSLPAGVKSFTDAGLVLDTGCLQAVQALLYFMYGAQVTITCNKDPSGMVRVRPGDHHGPNVCLVSLCLFCQLLYMHACPSWSLLTIPLERSVKRSYIANLLAMCCMSSSSLRVTSGWIV